MKTPSDLLFQFVQSFDPYERAYIKNSFSTYSPNTNNEKLFDYLCTCEKYDETTLLKSLPFLSRTTIKHAKQNLFDYLLKKLELYHTETDEEMQLQKLLLQARILRRKKIYRKAYQLLCLGINRAREYQLPLLEVQMQLELDELVSMVPGLKKIPGYEQHSLPDIDRLLNYFRQELTVTKIRTEMRSFVFSVYKTKDEIERKAGYFYRQAVAKKLDPNYLSFPDKIKLKIDHIEFMCLNLLHDRTRANSCFSAMLKRYEKRKLTSIAAKLELMNNLLTGSALCIDSQNAKLMSAINKKTDELVDTFRAKDFNMFLINFYFGIKGNLIAFLIRKNDFIAAKKESEELLKKIDLSKLQHVPQKVFLTNLTGIHLCCGEPKAALKVYNKIVTNPQLTSIKVAVGETTYVGNVLALAIYYDLKLSSNLKSMCGSCRRDKGFRNQSAAYKLLIDFFDALLKTKDDAGIKKLIKNTIKKINAVIKPGKDYESIHFLGMFEIKYWLNAKLKDVG